MKRKTVIVIFIFCLLNGHSQTGILNSGEYYYSVKDCFMSLRYRDDFSPDSLPATHIFKGNRIWRSIGLTNKQNQQIFNTNTSCLEVGFFEIIKFGLLDKKLHAFRSDNFDDTRKSILSYAEIVNAISYRDTTPEIHFDASGLETRLRKNQLKVISGEDVKTYLVKEDWVINSKSGKMEKYITGIAPLVFNEKENKVLPLFWLYYPEWKKLFASFEAQNPFSYEQITYYDVFEKHYYVSIISKESNVFDRGIKLYKHGSEINLESELINEKLLNTETDLFAH